MGLRCLVLVVSAWLSVTAVPTTASAEISPFDAQQSGHLFSLHGSNTIGARLAPELAQDYLTAKGAEDVRIRSLPQENEYRIEGWLQAGSIYIDVAAHGSGTGMRGLALGDAQIAMASRPIKASEQELLADFGPMRSFETEHVVAIDGLAVIVHPSNSFDALTVDQIARLFSGDVNNWAELGGPDLPVSLYARDDKSGTWDSFKSMVLNGHYSLNNNARRFESNDDLSDSVAADPGAIGFVGLASVRRAKALGVSQDGTRPLKPEPLYVATEDYALSRRLFMYTLPNRTPPIVREFIEFVHNGHGQERVAKVGFVSQNPMSLKPEVNPEAPDSYKNLVGQAERLSINFRFEQGSSRLDNKAQWDIERLSRYMAAPENHHLKLQLIGFGDAEQSEQRALVLSRLRALQVKAALRDRGIGAASVVGFGSDLPVAGKNEGAHLKNQRVEVWVLGGESTPARREAEEGAVSGVF